MPIAIYCTFSWFMPLPIYGAHAATAHGVSYGVSESRVLEQAEAVSTGWITFAVFGFHFR